MSELVDCLVENEIALIKLNNPPVNSLSLDVRNLFTSYFRQAKDDPNVRAIIIASEGKNFSAGADISEFDSADALSGSKLPDLCNELDSSPKILVAAINGVALGGTQRLTRLISPQLAADMMLTGKNIGAAEALQAGLIDRLHEGDVSLVDAAIEYTKELIANDAPLRDAADVTVDTSSIPDNYFQELRDRYVKDGKTGGALQSCILAIEAACTLPFNEGIVREHELFLERMHSAEARAIQHLFLAERKAAKIPGLDQQMPTRTMQKAGVIGAGLMGTGIAMNFVKSGIPVVLVDSSEDNVTRGLASMKKIYQSAVKKGRMAQEQLENYMSLVKGTVDYAELSDADIVIEAVFENIEVKKQVFQKLDAVCKPGAILATNTSTLDVNLIAETTSRPKDVIGLHFFSPAHVMKLLEIVRGDSTADDVLLTALKLARTIRKIPVVVGVCYGFVGNRMMTPYFREAYRMMLEGAGPGAIDSALMDFGMAMGIISVIDMAGIDIVCNSAEANREYWQADKSYLALLFRLRELGFIGQKSGQGVYKYDGREKPPPPQLAQITDAIVSELGIQQREISAEEITERCVLP